MKPEHAFEWQLGSWLGLPPALTWTLLALLGLGGILLASYWYRDTLRALTPGQRAILIALRAGFFLSLLFCLAGPSRVERVYEADKAGQPLAVLVDRSGSMTSPAGRSLPRLTSALGVWKRVEASARRAFPAQRYFSFSDSAHPAPSLDAALAVNDPEGATHLYDALTQVMKEAPTGGYAGIVTLTDGLDTTDATPDACASLALQQHCPLYFCVGQSSVAPAETLLVREFAVPGEVGRKAQFMARVVVEAHTRQARDVPLVLTRDGQPLASAQIHLQPGANLVPWTVPVNSDEPGLIHLQCQLGAGPEQETLAAAVKVVAQEKVSVLFFQGSLDWSARFITMAVQSDPSFTLTNLYSPNLYLPREVVPNAQTPALGELPDKADKLQPFQMVVLDNVVAGQLSAGQQAALADYVRGGGGLLFLVSDTAMATTFSGTALEGLMPVIFDGAPAASTETSAEKAFQDQMAQTSGSNPNLEGPFADHALASLNTASLQNFAVPAGTHQSDIADLFGSAAGGANLPRFVTYAHVHGLKAGAEALATHPQDKTDAGALRPLLAAQRFGLGHVTALLTDGLWRWRMSLPSDRHDPEIFWQQLFRTLARQEAAQDNLHFSTQPFFASRGQLSSFRVQGAQGATTVTVTSPSGQAHPIPAQVDADDGSWSFDFRPDAPGKWRIDAQDARGAATETLLRVSNHAHGDELSGLPPDTDGLRRLAVSTGGKLLDDGAPDDWSAAPAGQQPTLLSKQSQPLWDSWLLLLPGLGFYVTELIWRRRVRLL